MSSPEASASVLAAVTQKLTEYPFDFRGARILSGQEEGVFGWVTANYLLENFIKVGLLAGPVSHGAWAPTHGLTRPLLLTVQLGGPMVPAKEGDAGGHGPGRRLHTDHL